MVYISKKKDYGVKKVFLKGNIIKLSILVTGILVVFTAIITYYGQNVGNFVFSTGSDVYTRGIVLSTDREFSYAAPTIVTNPIKAAYPTTLAAIDLEEIFETDGTSHTTAGNVIGFTFYLKNKGLETVNVEYTIQLAKVTRNIDAAMRFLIAEERLGQSPSKRNITQYMKAEENYSLEYYKKQYGDRIIPYPETKFFLDNYTVAKQVVTELRPNEVVKYSFVAWIEGWDPDTTDKGDQDIRLGQLKMAMKFSVQSEKIK